MTRHLTVTRATVAPAHEAAYLGTLDELARHAEADGRHCWVFRDPERPGAYLEFREWGASAPAPSAEEARLEARLRKWAEAGPGAGTIWEEVPRAARPTGPSARS
jgi:hypothetical protein